MRSIERIAVLTLAMSSAPACQLIDTAPRGEPGTETQVDVDARSQRLFDDALVALERGQLRNAEVLLIELTDRNPGIASAWINLGHAYVQLQQPDRAQAAFERALALEPNDCTAHTQLGILARRAGDFMRAESNYRACLAHDPGFREALLNLGILYELYLGRLTEALEAYRSYQALLDTPDRRVETWVADLERRLVAANQS